jgi:hypothetical protein
VNTHDLCSDAQPARGTNTVQTKILRSKLNSVAVDCERAIPTERPPLVGEVGANFCG